MTWVQLHGDGLPSSCGAGCRDGECPTSSRMGETGKPYRTEVMEKEKQGKLLSYNRIGIVCSSGGGSAYMIKIQIESLFPRAEVKTFSFLQQDELKTFQPDLILQSCLYLKKSRHQLFILKNYLMIEI